MPLPRADKNKVGGWAASRDAVVEAIDLARRLGVTFRSGEAESLIVCPGPSGSDVKGVQTVDAREYRADFVIVACGSWTPKLLPELATNCLPTGQTVATVQLSKDEVEKHKDMPVSPAARRKGYDSADERLFLAGFALHGHWIVCRGRVNRAVCRKSLTTKPLAATVSLSARHPTANARRD